MLPYNLDPLSGMTIPTLCSVERTPSKMQMLLPELPTRSP